MYSLYVTEKANGENNWHQICYFTSDSLLYKSAGFDPKLFDFRRLISTFPSSCIRSARLEIYAWKRQRQRGESTLWFQTFFLSLFPFLFLLSDPIPPPLPSITALIYENIQTWHWAYDKHQVCIWGGEEINSSSGCDHYLCPDQSYSSRPACGGQPYQCKEGGWLYTHAQRHTQTNKSSSSFNVVVPAHTKLTSLPGRQVKNEAAATGFQVRGAGFTLSTPPFLISQISLIRELWSQTTSKASWGVNGVMRDSPRGETAASETLNPPATYMRTHMCT